MSSSPSYRAAIEGAHSNGRRRSSRNGAYIVTCAFFVLGFAVTLLAISCAGCKIGLAALVAACLVGWLLSSSAHIVLQWEKVVVLRLGKFNRVSGPGLVFTIPLVEHCTMRVDQRISATYFGAEKTLTNDLVPVNVDAVLFWMVFSAEKACVELEDYPNAVSWIAQTAMRQAIGRRSVSELACSREVLDAELEKVIEEKLSPWGIAIIGVEIRDIVIPKELQDAMAMESIAERERNARMVLAEAEHDISEMLADAGDVYANAPEAMKLRTMHLAYDSVRKSGGTLVIPSAFSEGFTDAALGHRDEAGPQALAGKAPAEGKAPAKQ